MVVGRTKDVDGNVAEQVDDLRERMRLLQGESTFVNLLFDFDIRRKFKATDARTWIF